MKRHNYIIVLALLVSLVILGSCSSPTAPDVPSKPECETNNTAQVQFKNESNTNTTYDVMWDGAYFLTVAPGITSAKYAVAAGTQHTLEFRITNTHQTSCGPSWPNLAQCSIHVFSCSY
jgi:PBP1b-binding outer membrane lipoprotein LpoB